MSVKTYLVTVSPISAIGQKLLAALNRTSVPVRTLLPEEYDGRQFYRLDPTRLAVKEFTALVVYLARADEQPKLAVFNRLMKQGLELPAADCDPPQIVETEL